MNFLETTHFQSRNLGHPGVVCSFSQRQDELDTVPEPKNLKSHLNDQARIQLVIKQGGNSQGQRKLYTEAW